jgi:hypothetical protein
MAVEKKHWISNELRPGLARRSVHYDNSYPQLENFELAGEKMKMKPPIFFAFEHKNLMMSRKKERNKGSVASRYERASVSVDMC